MEKKFQIKPVAVHLFCDDCKTVEVENTRTISNYYKTMYEYICPKCKKVTILPTLYPYVDNIETAMQVFDTPQKKESVKDILGGDK